MKRPPVYLDGVVVCFSEAADALRDAGLPARCAALLAPATFARKKGAGEWVESAYKGGGKAKEGKPCLRHTVTGKTKPLAEEAPAPAAKRPSGDVKKLENHLQEAMGLAESAADEKAADAAVKGFHAKLSDSQAVALAAHKGLSNLWDRSHAPERKARIARAALGVRIKGRFDFRDVGRRKKGG